MSAPLWTLDAMAAATGGHLAGTAGGAVTGISIDSRTLVPGDAFFAISDQRDGHDFVGAAVAAGASVAVVAGHKAGDLPPVLPLLVVPDVLAALVALGQAARRRVDAKVAAVTGSMGKTGTKEALALVLGREGPTHASVASYNNHWGVPLTLARMPAGTRYGVFEIGMNHAGEITPLTAQVRPDVAIVTTVEAVHLENFPSIEGIADAKAEIFSGLAEGGVAVLNRDNRFFDRLARQVGPARIVSFGAHASADVRLVDCALDATGSDVRVVAFGREIAYRLGAPGRHVVENSLGVLAVVATLGVDPARGAVALADLEAPPGRGRRHRLGLRGGGATLIDESYNANPVSVRAALALLGQTPPGPGGRRIAVLGDMLELGPDEIALHAGLADSIEANAVDRVFTCGRRMAALDAALPPQLRGAYADTSDGLGPLVADALAPGDVVMVKGSLGSRMGPLVKALVERFPSSPPE